MKTITLDETAYNRLKAWKSGGNDSFSAVIKRLLPEPGTLGAFINFLETRNVELDADTILEDSINERSTEKNDSWRPQKSADRASGESSFQSGKIPWATNHGRTYASMSQDFK